ncbi:MAG: AlpA family transcriptional regulator [Gammaproteobacteria bacterium]|nr:AlpA family transcriptional regulator [Gammaproteobacteria bacterium]MBU0785492.1 AlpA family transcriptional regulator [Gammaproteobacteria bacterium]MBU0813692.1 AlpA family transcriptional regulator [Gammaproteobacteria bacterium]MBU1788836.1 AlpA family transcriptional regulator [Gammaproteobacteria bacterium]
MPDKFIRLPEVIAITARSKPTIYVDIKKGKFPAPINIGERAVAWLSSDIEKWIAQRVAQGWKSGQEKPTLKSRNE